jgi:hypothetical protein
MLSSRACRLPQGEVFYDAVAATACRVPRDALLTGVTSVDVRGRIEDGSIADAPRQQQHHHEYLHPRS